MDLLTGLLFVAGLVLLIAGGESLVRGASRIAIAAGISPVLVGLTVVAFGTSAPELAVAIGGAVGGQPDLVIGNVVGSNIYNILLVLGLSAVIAPLLVEAQLVRRDVPLMLLASIATLWLASDGTLQRTDGLLLVGALVVWIGYSIWESRRSTRARSGDQAEETPPRASLAPRLLDIGAIVLGLVLLVIGARWLVDGAVAVALGLGLSSLVIGLTVVAIGTSLPELATSIIASIRGQRDIAVGNVVGSNIFNLLAVLGITAIIVDIPVAPGALAFDFPVMVAVAGASLPIFFSGGRIGRREGALFVAYGIGYTVYLVATSTEHTGLTSLTEALATVVLPLTALTLFVIAVRELQRRRAARTGEPAAE